MHRLRSLALLSALTLATPAVAVAAQPQWGAQGAQPAYNEGYNRGRNAGITDARRGDRFGFTDESDYRRGDVGYRSGYGNRERYRDAFRSGFEAGYRDGYRGYGPGRNGSDNRAGWPNGSNSGRFAVAYQNGANDGYEEGLKDGRDGRRFDPVAESRYRNADHGYDRRDGSKDAYKIDYRVGFKAGYERGYQDGRRYDDRERERGWFGF